MKKIFLVFFFSFILIIVAGLSVSATVTLKFGYDYYGYHRLLSTTDTTEVGYTLAFELTSAEPGDRSEWGFGIEAATKRQIEDTNRGFQFVPIYASFSYYGTANDQNSFYVTTRLGYNLFIADYAYKTTDTTEGGAYYALGFGYSSGEHSRIEVLYSNCQGDLGGEGVKYSRTSISYGFRF
jgi:hypothetical protein